MQAIGIGRPVRQDTFDLRDQIHSDDNSHVHAHVEAHNTYGGTSDEEHSVLEDDSDAEDRDVDYMDEDDDGSSSLSIPNESIDFDLVYSLHSFAATVEGQANVVKGDSLFLMDDSNSYWWLVRVLKTQEVGYIPAENIETPFERLARLNKHRNVDLASATQAELQEDVHASRDRLRNNLVSSRAGQNTPSPIPGISAGPRPGQPRGVVFKPALSVHRYPPAVWSEEEEEEEDVEWDDDPYEDEDPELADEEHQQRMLADHGGGLMSMEPDDGMSWDDGVAEDMQARHAQARTGQIHGSGIPAALQAGLKVDPSQQSLQAQQQQHLANQQAATQQAHIPTQTLRQQTSRERLLAVQDGAKSLSQSSPGPKVVDPAEITETRKLTVTPSIVRDQEQPAPQTQSSAGGPLLPSAIMQKQDEERKRTREEIEALEESSRKKVKSGKEKPPPVATGTNQRSSGSPVAGGKLRKEPQLDEENAKDKKKRGGLFSGLFGNKKDKKDKTVTSADGGSLDYGRGSSESGRSSNQHSGVDSTISPVTATAIQQQGITSSMRNSSDPRRAIQQQQPQQSPQTPPQSAQLSQHASQLRQRDQQQQALYKQYLTHSPSSPPELSPNYGLQTASAVMPAGSASFNNSSSSGVGLGFPSSRPRPGSLVLSPTAMDGQNVGVPELSVIRVFAGENVQTEATFKTVLLNTSTTSSDLVRQAIQRFRLPAGEDEKDYYLTVKQVEGSSAVLLASENPLGVFETLVEAAMELPKVKRSSVGSISSVASNLSMHPAIKKLSMNDFTDDSAVKFYLNRKGDESVDGSLVGDDGDETMAADMSFDSEASRSQYLSINSPNSVNADRFSSPSFRFPLQLVIYPDDLPDDMVFDPLTEAIVFRNTLRDRSQTNIGSSPGISQSMRRKVFMLPKNVTVAEVIEVGLERFGILEGVVDGGDEVEDKLTKRRSSVRVRYGLTVDIGVQERELSPSSKVIDAYPRPPTYRAAERKTGEGKRRSVDSAQLLGNLEDVSPDDPTFVLRRAISYRSSSSRHRLSAPLDEIALSRLHRESASGSSVSSDTGATDEGKPKQQSRQELIAAQRAASRANQKSILSTQTNSVRGVDVLLPGNAMLRSSRYDTGDKMRYSYVEPDGETYDISDIVEEEWQDKDDANKNDLLEGVFVKNKDGLGDNFDRVLNKIKDGKASGRVPTTQSLSGSQLDSLGSMRSASPSEYSIEQSNSRSTTPLSAGFNGRTPTPTSATFGSTHKNTVSSSRTTTPTGQDAKNQKIRTNTSNTSRPQPHRNPSIASVMSDMSGYGTPSSHMPDESPDGSPRSAATPKPQQKRPYLPKDDFGLSHMMTLIQLTGSSPKPPVPPMDVVDELLFGRKLDMEALHPQIRDIFSESFKQLEAIDKTLDDFLQHSIRT